MQNTGEVGRVEKGWPIKYGNIGHIQPPWIGEHADHKDTDFCQEKDGNRVSKEWGGNSGLGHLDDQLNTGTLDIFGCTARRPSTIPNQKNTKSF